MSPHADNDATAPPPFAVATDVVVFTDDLDRVVLVERGNEPFKGMWALPGGFVEIDEDLPEAAVRELAEETGLRLSVGQLHQAGVYGRPGRDPRMRVVSIVFWASVPELPEPKGSSDAAAAFVKSVAEVLADPDRLAFDHHRIIGDSFDAANTTAGS